MTWIILINSPLFRDKIENYDEDSLPPIGLEYIATNLRNNGIDVELLDSVAHNIPLEEIVSKINSQRPKFVGMNIFSPNFELVREIIERSGPEINFIVGGKATKDTYQEILKFNTKNNLEIIIGDGEYIVIDILNEKLREEPIVSAGNKRVFSVMQNSIYLPKDISNIPLDRSFFSNEPDLNPQGQLEASIITSRGCIYNCSFCGAARSLNRELPIRMKSKKSIEEEISHLKSIYPHLESIRILDDLFLRNIQDMESATEMFRGDIYWRSMAHILSFRGASSDLLNRLKQSGCSEVFIGIESGSKKVLKMINKPHQLEYLKNTICSILDAGINVKGYFIYGFPNENKEDMLETYELAYSLKEHSINSPGNFRVSVFQFRPYHGTELYNNLFKRGEKTLNFKLNSPLSSNIGRKQFNVVAKNFSLCDQATLDEYITMTMALNNTN